MDTENLPLDLDAARIVGAPSAALTAGPGTAAPAGPGAPAGDLAPPPANGGPHAAADATNGHSGEFPGPDRVCGARPGAPEAGPQDEGRIAAALDAGLLPRRLGLPHPLKPRSDAQKARFAAIWQDPDVPLAEIAARYRACERSVQGWRAEFGLPPRDQIQARRRRRQPWATGAPGWQAEPSDTGSDSPAGPLDPLKDAEIAATLADLGDEARRIGPGTDLAALNRKLARLSLLVATKAPAQTWASLEQQTAGLNRATVWMRKVEAGLPAPEADQAQLRREAAARMMRELKAVLTSEEQGSLAAILKAGAARLMAKQSQKSASSAAGVSVR